MNPPFFCGMPVVVNDATYQAPVRGLPSRPWHAKRCYAKRVQKKWARRYGWQTKKVVEDGVTYVVSGTYVMNSASLDLLRKYTESKGR